MIVAFSGPAGSGKSTAARILVERRGFVELSLAAPMKRIAADLFAFSDAQLYGPSSARNAVDPRYGVSPRMVLQRLGTEFGRACYEDVWVDRVLRDAREHERVTIPDVRFRNELRAIQSAGGIVVRLTRAGSLPGDTHPSEAEMATIGDDEYDAVIDNRAMTLGELAAAVTALAPVRMQRTDPVYR